MKPASEILDDLKMAGAVFNVTCQRNGVFAWYIAPADKPTGRRSFQIGDSETFFGAVMALKSAWREIDPNRNKASHGSASHGQFAYPFKRYWR